MRILVTGGAGYIGSHAVQQLLAQGHEVVVLDNLFRGHRAALERLGLGRAGSLLHFVEGTITHAPTVGEAFINFGAIDAVMHFAALAYVGESVHEPLRYFDANITGLLTVLEACKRHGVASFIFSSSCSTYGNPPAGLIPVAETCPQSPVSPYGRSKLVGEWIIRDFAAAQAAAKNPFSFAFLRYFNVCGCDATGLLGEDHTPESHLLPVIMQVALGQREYIDVYGEDYPTPDGTCVRDYVHIEDLVAAHLLAMAQLTTAKSSMAVAYNVGLGRGYSVREIIAAARVVTGHAIPVRQSPRRAGDAAMLYNDPMAITRDLAWSPRYTDLNAIIETAWNWFKAHPTGYGPSRSL